MLVGRSTVGHADRDRAALLRRTFPVLNDDVRTKGDQLLLRLQKPDRFQTEVTAVPIAAIGAALPVIFGSRQQRNWPSRGLH